MSSAMTWKSGVNAGAIWSNVCATRPMPCPITSGGSSVQIMKAQPVHGNESIHRDGLGRLGGSGCEARDDTLNHGGCEHQVTRCVQA